MTDVLNSLDMASLVTSPQKDSNSSIIASSPRSPSPPTTPPDESNIRAIKGSDLHSYNHTEKKNNKLATSSSSIFIEHLEDALPTQEEMEAFDCFSPGAYIATRRRHSLDLSHHSGLGVSGAGGMGGMMMRKRSGDISSFSSSSAGFNSAASGLEAADSRTSSLDYYARRASYAGSPAAALHRHLSPEPPIATGSNTASTTTSPSPAPAPAATPFAALVRRISYTSSRFPRHSKNGSASMEAGRPQTSSGPLMNHGTTAGVEFKAVQQELANFSFKQENPVPDHSDQLPPVQTAVTRSPQTRIAASPAVENASSGRSSSPAVAVATPNRRESLDGLRRPSLGGGGHLGWPWSRRASSTSLASPRPGSSSSTSTNIGTTTNNNSVSGGGGGAFRYSPGLGPGILSAAGGGANGSPLAYTAGANPSTPHRISLSPSPSFVVLNKITPPSSTPVTPDLSGSPYKVSSPSSSSSDSANNRTPGSPNNLPFRALSPLSNLPTPNSEDGMRPSKPRRSLSASFSLLGKKVANFGNLVAVNAAASSSSTTPSSASSLDGSPIVPRVVRQIGQGGKYDQYSPQSMLRHSTSSLVSVDSVSKETPIRRGRSPGPAMSYSSKEGQSVPEEEVPWSFKVHGVYPATTGVPPKNTLLEQDHLPIQVPLQSTLTESPRNNLLSLSTSSRPSSPLATLKPVSGDASSLDVEQATVIRANDLLSPARAIQGTTLLPRSELPESPFKTRPGLQRNAKSDDGGLSARTTQQPEVLSTSAPLSPSAIIRQTQYQYNNINRSPSPRQPSPSPSRNLTQIPEAEEQQEMQTRKEEWLASLRGKSTAGKRRLSAADIFGVPAGIETSTATSVLEQVKQTSEVQISNRSAADDASSISHDKSEHSLDEITPSKLDFTKQPVVSPSELQDLNSPTKALEIESEPGYPSNTAARPRAISQSSLLSASRPHTPGDLLSTSSSNPALRPFSVSSPSDSSGQYGHHRHSQSVPAVSREDLAAMEVTGAGAQESSVMTASHARFAKALSGNTQSQGGVPPSTPKKSISTAEKEAMKQLMLESSQFENAIEDEEGSVVPNPTLHAALPSDNAGLDDLISSTQRTPKLSYATSASDESDPSVSAPPRARIWATPTKSTKSNLTATSSRITETGSSTHTTTSSSSMSNADASRSAFDILLSKQGMNRIDGMPGSRVASWARRDASDDSEVTISTVDSESAEETDRDPFDGSRVSVW